MAGASSNQLIITSLFTIFIQLNFFIAFSSSAHHRLLDTSPRGDGRRSMVLPLYSLSQNSSKKTISNPRRYLRNYNDSNPNARMPLYDDLLLNGYYTTRLLIGTPPQTFALIVDTGSTVTYVPCSNCEQCGRHQDPKFQPELSSTYQPVKCNPDCNCDDDRGQCTYERQYAEMSSSSGYLGEDIISFGNISDLSPQRAVFGCENVETGDLYSQHADGIMGLGQGDLSIVDQLVDKRVISDSFSLCYGGMHVGGGAMILGDISPPPDMVIADSDPTRSPYYNIDLKEIHVAGKRLPLNPSVFDGKHGTVLDSGTTYAYLPEAAFLAFKKAIIRELSSSTKQIDGPDPNYKDICFLGGTSVVQELSNIFPAVEMVFGNGQKVLISPENYLFQHSKVPGGYCLGIFQNGNDPTTLIGGIVVRNTLVMYDRENSKIGLWKTNCSELWERLHIVDASPPLSPSSQGNDSSSTDSNSTSNPLGSSGPGEIQSGQVILDLSLSINLSDLKSRIDELTNFIAMDLNVSEKQVHLVNLTSKGNSSLVTLAILPSESTSYISNVTEMSIVARFSEHRVQLPDKFGHYDLVKWEIKPLVNRNWWQRHYSSVVLAIVGTLIAGLVVSGMWIIWRNRHQSANPYKPVDGTIAEQELQPI